jgi:hypothetical protein
MSTFLDLRLSEKVVQLSDPLRPGVTRRAWSALVPPAPSNDRRNCEEFELLFPRIQRGSAWYVGCSCAGGRPGPQI